MKEPARDFEGKSGCTEIFGSKGFLIFPKVNTTARTFMISGTPVLPYKSSHCIYSRKNFLSEQRIIYFLLKSFSLATYLYHFLLFNVILLSICILLTAKTFSKLLLN